MGRFLGVVDGGWLVGWGGSWVVLGGWGRVVGLGLWVDSGALVLDVSDVAVVVVGGVGHRLDTAVG